MIIYHGKKQEIKNYFKVKKLHEIINHKDWDIPDDYHSKKVIIIVHNFKITAIFGYRKYKNVLFAEGTIVLPKYRKLGLGKKMWQIALQNNPEIDTVKVICATDQGFTLVESLKKCFPKYKWVVKEIGGRKLRKLTL